MMAMKNMTPVGLASSACMMQKGKRNQVNTLHPPQPRHRPRLDARVQSSNVTIHHRSEQQHRCRQPSHARWPSHHHRKQHLCSHATRDGCAKARPCTDVRRCSCRWGWRWEWKPGKSVLAKSCPEVYAPPTKMRSKYRSARRNRETAAHTRTHAHAHAHTPRETHARTRARRRTERGK